MIRKLRAQKIEIDLPTETSPVWLHAIVQRAIKDDDTYETSQLIDMVGHINRNAEGVATELETIYDPVTGQTVQLSGAGVTIAIKAFIIRWLSEDFDGQVNDAGDFIEQ